ncbi:MULTISPECIES: hypothetical protein [Winogradskyella]|uniref:hypothetical protein n=1 Tax=Winogradskyella TaxID=286104 RepID=UPI0015CD72F4|nr:MULTISPECIES: hypothetical protein [Winogradskyella]QXP79823.1 hypothetical protein H0I32_04050 [Winogradskyella sp. HaHa_3_26]
MSFIQSYNDALSSSNSLQEFINSNFDKVYDNYSLSNHENISKNREEFKRLALRINTIRTLDFNVKKNEAYLNLILNTSVRLGDLFVFQQFYRILVEEKLHQSNLVKACALFMLSRTSHDFMNAYDAMLTLLEETYKNDTDTNKEPIAILVYFYALFVKYFAEFAREDVLILKEKIETSYNSKTFGFLNDVFIEDILAVTIDHQKNPYSNIQNLLDKFLERHQISTSYITGFLLEKNTNYALKLIGNNLNIVEIQELNKKLYMPIQTNEIFYSLGRGTAILESENQLLAYMYAHGKKHIAKLKDAFKGINITELKNINLIDWGCGQGIASKMFIDTFGINMVNSVTLIEPSECALKRAALHINNDVTNIKTINKGFDELNISDLKGKSIPETENVHLFSNVIDMDFFNLSSLINNIQKSFSGIQYIVLSSPYIDVAKTERINLFTSKLLLNKGALLLEETKSKGSWINGWSKVVRVFKIEL